MVKDEPLKLQFDAFLDSHGIAQFPEILRDGGASTLEVALAILDKIKEHAQIVSQTLVTGWKP